MGLFWPEKQWLDIWVLVLAVALDLALPEPPLAAHPVVWMGKLAGLLDRLSPRSGRVLPFLAGLGIALAVPATFGGAAFAVAWWLQKLGPLPYLVVGAVLLKTTFTVRGLARAARQAGRALEAGDMDGARQSLRSLVRRDAGNLTVPLMASAAVESVAENTTDSYIGPWLAFALLGLPGAFMYRAVNTLDSMLGYHGPYEYLGKASARLDDVVNLVPARLSALFIVVAGAPMRLNVRHAWQRMWREHGTTESPNAGWTMSAMAGLLGVALEKPGRYHLGEGLRDPAAPDVYSAVWVCYAVALLGIAAAAGIVLGRSVL